MISQRELVEIISFSVFTFKSTKLPNPLSANVWFAAMNYPSIALYMLAYIISIRRLLPQQTSKVPRNGTKVRSRTIILAVGGQQQCNSMIDCDSFGEDEWLYDYAAPRKKTKTMGA